MNMPDDFENRLSNLRPGRMPDVLKTRLAEPPALEKPARGKMLWGVFTAAAVAACAAAYFRPAPVDPVPAGPVIAAARSSRVTEVQRLSVITDEANRPWKFVHVQWVEEDTVVSPESPAAVQHQEYYATVVPVAVTFD